MPPTPKFKPVVWNVAKISNEFREPPAAGVMTGGPSPIISMVDAHRAAGGYAPLTYKQAQMWGHRREVPSDRLAELFAILIASKGESIRVSDYLLVLPVPRIKPPAGRCRKQQAGQLPG